MRRFYFLLVVLIFVPFVFLGQQSVKFGGRLQNDFSFYSQNTGSLADFGKIPSAMEFRRARFFSSGKLDDKISYKLQIDFSSGEVRIKDAYVKFSDIFFDTDIKIGHIKQPWTYQLLTSSKNISFLERSFADGLISERNMGFFIEKKFEKQRVTLMSGLYFNTNDIGKVENLSKVDFASKLIFLPFKTDKFLLHTALGYSRHRPVDSVYNFDFKPENHLAPVFLSGGIKTDLVDLFFAELITALGAFHSEFVYSRAIIHTINVENLQAFYLNTGFFITGETLNYKNGELKRIKPKSNKLPALELVMRYSIVDAKNINGQFLIDYTAGVNLWFNSHTRLLLNYILSDFNRFDRTNIFSMRLQVDF